MNRLIICSILIFTAGLSASHAGSEANGTYKIDPVHSSVVFAIRHLDISSVYGRFNEFSGNFTYDADQPSKSQFDVTIRTETVDTGNSKRDEHLRSPDFFNAKQFSTARFQSKQVQENGSGKLRVIGDLTFHGKTKPVTADLEITGQGNRGPRFGYRSGLAGKFTIKRSDFGMDYMLDGGMLGDEVEIIFSLQAQRQ